MPVVHTEALAGRGVTCRWMSAAAVASGNRVLTSFIKNTVLTLKQTEIHTAVKIIRPPKVADATR